MSKFTLTMAGLLRATTEDGENVYIIPAVKVLPKQMAVIQYNEEGEDYETVFSLTYAEICGIKAMMEAMKSEGSLLSQNN